MDEATAAFEQLVYAQHILELDIAEEVREILHELLIGIQNCLERTTLISQQRHHERHRRMDALTLCKFGKEHLTVLLQVLKSSQSCVILLPVPVAPKSSLFCFSRIDLSLPKHISEIAVSYYE